MARSILLVLVLALGCEDPVDPSDAAADSDAGPAADDAGSDAGGPQTCEEKLMERQVALDRDGPLTQIHPAALFDGEAIWVVYNRPDADGGFDVYATRRDCDGTVLIEPFLVQTRPEGNDIDPSIVQSGDTLLIAWVTDDGTGGTDNLQIGYRTFELDGTPRMSADAQLTTTRMGAPITDNHTGVELAAMPDGRFVAAGARAVPDVMRFQAFAQVIDADGALDGEALEPLLEMDVTQSGPAIDVTDAGALWLAYDRAPDMNPAQVMISSLDGAAPELAIEGLTDGGGPDVLAHDGAVWVAFAGAEGANLDVRIVNATEPLATRSVRSIGLPGRAEHSPRLAVGEDRVAVAFFRQIRGFTNEVLLASVTDPSIEPVTVNAESPAYQPALTHVLGDWWFVAYAIGDSPEFRLAGRFVELTAP